ncbi:MAG: GNAT family N-acetyltransferase [Oscillospiraceae bacterium]|nr:GNAT family N-acetyltransferase [Oscillospiraceae bacterium]
MHFHKTVQLKNGQTCVLRHAEAADAEAFLEYFLVCHGETDYLTTYPDETEHAPEKVAARLAAGAESAADIEILAVVDGKLAGSAGIGLLRDRDKTRHRAEFGISVLRDYWGLGIGRALTAACIDCAEEAGYLQLELEAVSENAAALHLYEKYGFVEYGRNPRGFRNRAGKWQELVLMRLELPRDGGTKRAADFSACQGKECRLTAEVRDDRY